MPHSLTDAAIIGVVIFIAGGLFMLTTHLVVKAVDYWLDKRP